MAQRNTDVGWMQRAACRGRDPHLFHPPDLGDEHVGVAWDPAPGIFVCLRGPCPVLLDCELFARANGEASGIWGGIDFGREHKRSRRGSTVGLRERVLALAAKGYDAQGIAELLGMEPRSVGRMLARKRRVEV